MSERFWDDSFIRLHGTGGDITVSRGKGVAFLNVRKGTGSGRTLVVAWSDMEDLARWVTESVPRRGGDRP